MQKFFLALIVLISIPFLVWFFKNPQTSIRSRFQTSKPVITPTGIKTNTVTGNCSSVRVNTPKPYEKISSLVIVSVTIDNSKKDCIWTVFEAQAGIAAITDLQGNTLGSAPLKTTGDWTAQKP